MSALIEVKHLTKSFQSDQAVLNDISFELRSKEVLAVIGSSGSGKSTLLSILAGFEFPDAGEILKNSEVVSNASYCLNPSKRKIGMIFQDFALFPHLTVDKNIRFGFNGKDDEEIEALYRITGLGSLRKRYPQDLSGGEKQRVAMARALAAKPDVLLMDEPFSGIDVILRTSVRSELKDLISNSGVATILVTHDHQDVMALANKVLVLNDAEIVQRGTPQELYNNPNSLYVAQLFGPCNEIKGNWDDQDLETEFGTIKGAKPYATAENSVLIRPEKIHLHDKGALKAKVASASTMEGKTSYVLAGEKSKLEAESIRHDIPIDTVVRFDTQLD